MIVLGTHVPFSGWTAAALGGGVGLGLTVGRWWGGRRWGRPATGAAVVVSLAGVLAFTVTPDGHLPPIGLAPCIPHGLADWLFNIFHTGGGPVGDLFNLLLLVPLSISLVLLPRRPDVGVHVAGAVALLLPVSIELAQTMIPGRYCAISDVLTNTTGGLLGVLAGYWWRARRDRPTSSPGGTERTGAGREADRSRPPSTP